MLLEAKNRREMPILLQRVAGPNSAPGEANIGTLTFMSEPIHVIRHLKTSNN